MIARFCRVCTFLSLAKCVSDIQISRFNSSAASRHFPMHFFVAGKGFKDARVGNASALIMYKAVFTLQHVLVGIVSDSEQVRGHLQLPLSSVFSDDTVIVDWEALVRVDSDAEKSRVCLKNTEVTLLAFKKTFVFKLHFE